MADSPTQQRVRALVEPIVADLRLDLYDLELAGGQLTVTVDTPPGSDGGVTLDTLALATRLISRELDHADPIPGRYTLEVTSPGLERPLRRPEHFRREVGKEVSVRLRDVGGDQRRLHGTLVAADDDGITVRLDDAALTERTVEYSQIDRARTVFAWGPAPKPGKGAPARRPKQPSHTSPVPASAGPDTEAPGS